jgi:hypothetical protein
MNVLLKKLFFVALAGFALAGTASASTAELELQSAGVTSIIIVDQGPGDASTVLGQVNYSNSNFNGWNIEVTAGVSNSPTINPNGLDLTALVQPSSTLAPTASLDIFFSDINFNVPISGFNTFYSATMTGNTATTTNEIAWVDNTNTIFGQGSVIGNVGPFNPSGGSGIATGGSAGGPLYSLTLEQVFNTNAGNGVTLFSVDGNITPTPEPASMMLFGTGLLGLAVAFSQRKRLGLSNGPLADC